MAGKSICSIDGCDKRYAGFGLCQTHLRRKRLYGDPNYGGAIKRKPSNGELYDWLIAHSDSQEEGCIEWPYNQHSQNGYGAVRHEGKSWGAHRLMCTIAHGEAPADKPYVAHECGNGKCLNPNHLYHATPSENVEDMRRHDTISRGERRPRVKYTVDTVRHVKQLLAAGSAVGEVSAKTGMDKSSIHQIRMGRNWAWVA